MKSTSAAVMIFLLLSSIGPAQSSEPDSVVLTVLTWNILHGTDADGELNLEAKGTYITEQDADLVFLQEVDEKCERSGRIDQMDVLGRITGMDALFGSFMAYQGGHYGLGALTSLRFDWGGAFRLPEGDEPRVATLLRLEVLGRPLMAVNVHFNWTEDDTSRFAQARALLTELATLDLPVIVAGDFNDEPGSRTMEAFFAAGYIPVEEPGPSWNALDPSVDIDHILIRSGPGLQLEPIGGKVLKESHLSDHRPVRGRIRVLASTDDGS